MIVWECSLIGKLALAPEEVVERVRGWLMGIGERGEVAGSRTLL